MSGRMSSTKTPQFRSSQIRKIMTKVIKIKAIEREVTLDGLMTLGKLETGLHTADFQCCEDVRLEGFTGTFKVQVMKDGNMYMTEKPRRVRNKAIFRDDNASLSQGRNGRWYFYFSMDEDRICELPQELVRQASAIAQKVIRELTNGK